MTPQRRWMGIAMLLAGVSSIACQRSRAVQTETPTKQAQQEADDLFKQLMSEYQLVADGEGNIYRLNTKTGEVTYVHELVGIPVHILSDDVSKTGSRELAEEIRDGIFEGVLKEAERKRKGGTER